MIDVTRLVYKNKYYSLCTVPYICLIQWYFHVAKCLVMISWCEEATVSASVHIWLCCSSFPPELYLNWLKRLCTADPEILSGEIKKPGCSKIYVQKALNPKMSIWRRFLAVLKKWNKYFLLQNYLLCQDKNAFWVLDKCKIIKFNYEYIVIWNAFRKKCRPPCWKILVPSENFLYHSWIHVTDLVMTQNRIGIKWAIVFGSWIPLIKLYFTSLKRGEHCEFSGVTALLEYMQNRAVQTTCGLQKYDHVL